MIRVTLAGAIVSLDFLNGLEVEVARENITPTEPLEAPPVALPTPHEPSDTFSYADQSTRVTEPSQAVDGNAIVVIPALPEMSEVEQLPTDDVCGVQRYFARRSIEALRFGIVPSHGIEEMTLGYPEIHHWVRELLPSAHEGKPRVAEIAGPFGSGKSHMMAIVRHVAEEHGYLTAHVEVDGKGISLADPGGILRQLLPTLAAREFHSSNPLVELNLRAVAQGVRTSAELLEPFDRIRSNHLTLATLRRAKLVDRHSDRMENLMCCDNGVSVTEMRWAMVYDVRQTLPYPWDADVVLAPKKPIGTAVVERPDDFVKCLVGYSVLARLAGFNGLVITVDEFEVEVANITRARQQRLDDTIDALRRWLGVRKPPAIGPLAIFIATVGAEGHLGDQVVEGLVKETDGATRCLEEWTEAEYADLARRIYAMYAKAYGISHDMDSDMSSRARALYRTADQDGSGQIRWFIKHLVAELDNRFGPKAA